jgi:S-DNA-T family DNA segregation ATPase FtsK/SpoIIIE
MNKRMKSRLTENGRNLKSGVNTGRKSNKEEDFKISLDAKKQILGFLILMLGLLSLLAIISYSVKDQATLERIGFFDIFRKETYSSIFEIYNWLGIAGAFTSGYLVNQLFGYFSSVISIILIIIGIIVVWKRKLVKHISFFIYSIILMAVLASSTGLLKIFFGSSSISSRYSGAGGDFFATIFYQTFGSVGSTVFFLFSLFIIILLLVDRNIAKTFARAKLLYEKGKESFRKEKDKLKAKSLEKKIQKSDDAEKLKAVESNGDLSIKEAIEKEREKILQSKYSGDLIRDERELIKDTEIQRPQKEIEELKKLDSFEDEQEKNKGLKSTFPNTPARGEVIEKTAYQEDTESIDGLVDYDDNEFIEEKLESFVNPTVDLLDEPSREEFEVISDEELNLNGRLLQEKLLKFGIEIEKVFATPGPVVTLYELIPAADVKLSKIESLQDDIALAMKAKGIRMIIPIPGKGTVGVEIPNQKSQIVKIKSILSSQKYIDSKKRLPIAFGKTINGEVFVDDLYKMPHVMIAGATGSGKSVGINTIIASLIYKLHPSCLKFILIDPKKIELSLYSKLRKHYLATSKDVSEDIITSSLNAVSILKSVELEMEQRYDKLANAGVRNIEAYNQRFNEETLKDTDTIKHRMMPYIIIIIDELADLMITAKRDIEDPIARIAQMARAVGIHLIVATQRPSVDVITGVIKANFPVRIAYQVASKIDSRTILDQGGAEQLLRNGDMLYLSSASPKPIRIQNAFITSQECEKIVDFIGNQEGFSKPYPLPSVVGKRIQGMGGFDERDIMFEEAARLILKLQQCSTSTLQRRLRLGYARAARIVDQMEDAGIVGPNLGAKGREILITEDELEDRL